MLSAIKKIVCGSRSKNGYYIGRYSKEEYYSSYWVSKTYGALAALFTKQRPVTIAAQELITFKFADFGTSPREAEKKIGHKVYSFQNEQVAGHQVRTFRTTMGGFKVVVQMHYLSNRFFMGKYIFKDFQATQLPVLKELMRSKYHLPNQVDPSQVLIRDEKGNQIFLEDSSFGTIYYLSGDQQIIDQIQGGCQIQDKLLVKNNLVKMSHLYACL